jgi:alkanesulfonate monooxygenase SsuD/methylene tetrahydromethanopterin reductase-like flavin-dependent oxidoreductase (luciferase family)
MVDVGLLLSDSPRSVPPQQQFSDMLRVVEAAQRNGFTHIAIGQHFLYGEIRWLQPVPLLARLAAEVDPHIKLVTQVMIAPLYHPVMLAEEIATLDIVTEGRLIFGAGLGYRPDEYEQFGVPYKERGKRFDELLQIMIELWTKDKVTFAGQFHQLDGVEPHIQPVQSPHPTMWIGGHAVAGVRRAGRFGDAYACTPEATKTEIATRYAIVQEEFAKRGKPFIPQPLRRNCWIGDTEEDAIVDFARVAQGRYVTYSDKGLGTIDGQALTGDFKSAVAGRAVVGTAESVVAELTDLVTSLPVDPLLIRPGWPTMNGDETIAVIERFGREVLPALNAIPPRLDVDPGLLADAPQ